MRHQRTIGLVLVALGPTMIGLSLGNAVAQIPTADTDAQTITLPGSVRTEQVTVRLPGKVIRRVDHVLVVRTPRYVFIYEGRRKVIRPKTVRIRFTVTGPMAPPVVAAVLNSGTPATVTVPVTVPVPGPTVTAPASTMTVTLPQATTTVTIPVTTTLPLTSG